MIKKTLQPTNDMYLQFTEEELQTLNMKPGDKFEVKSHEDGSIELRPYVKLELDMKEWPREILEMIIKESCEQDISANDVISNLIKEGLDQFEKNSTCCGGGYQTNADTLKSECGISSESAVLPTAFNSDCSTHSSDKLYTSVKTNNAITDGFIDPNFTNNDTSIATNHELL